MAEDIQDRLDKLEDTRIPSVKELESLRVLIEDYNRTKWLWSSLKAWIIGLTSVIALLTVGVDGVKSILKRLVS